MRDESKALQGIRDQRRQQRREKGVKLRVGDRGEEISAYSKERK